MLSSVTGVLRMTLLAVMVLLAGCGSGPSAGSEPDGLSLEVSFDPEPPRQGQPVTWSLEVRNHGQEPVTLTFSSGQSGDVVLGRGGRERYRWSAERFFTEAVRKERLEPGQRKVYRLEEPELRVDPGGYELVASLASEPAPAPVRRQVTVER